MAKPFAPPDPRQLRKLLREIDSRRHYDAATLLHWTVSDHKYCVGCAVAMDQINKYLVGARTQIRRIKRSVEKIDQSHSDMMKPGLSPTSWQAALEQAFLDIHYYFVCWDAARKMIEFLKTHSGFKAVGEVYKHHRRVLERYGDARDHLEHYDERLCGRKKKENLAVPSDMGNLHGYVYTLGGERYDAGPDSLKKLERIVSDLNGKICEEGIVRFQKIREEESKLGHH